MAKVVCIPNETNLDISPGASKDLDLRHPTLGQWVVQYRRKPWTEVVVSKLTGPTREKKP